MTRRFVIRARYGVLMQIDDARQTSHNTRLVAWGMAMAGGKRHRRTPDRLSSPNWNHSSHRTAADLRAAPVLAGPGALRTRIHHELPLRLRRRVRNRIVGLSTIPARPPLQPFSQYCLCAQTSRLGDNHVSCECKRARNPLLSRRSRENDPVGASRIGGARNPRYGGRVGLLYSPAARRARSRSPSSQLGSLPARGGVRTH